MVRALREMGAMRVRVTDDGVDVGFAAPAIPVDEAEVNRERELERRKQEDEDDLFRSAG